MATNEIYLNMEWVRDNTYSFIVRKRAFRHNEQHTTEVVIPRSIVRYRRKESDGRITFTVPAWFVRNEKLEPYEQ